MGETWTASDHQLLKSILTRKEITNVYQRKVSAAKRKGGKPRREAVVQGKGSKEGERNP